MLKQIIFISICVLFALVIESGAMKPIIIVHGGAGDISESRIQGKFDGVKVAVRAGYEKLMNGGSALDSVEAAVVSMELDENFNAGYGSVLNLNGEVEMEASIMWGQDLISGAVTLIKEFQHPISIARKVLTDTPHSFLGGNGAKLFALEKGFQQVAPESLISESAKEALNDFLNKGDDQRTEIGRKDEGGVGTVGAVAIDADGHIAVATSTGGINGKMVGRIGDTPLIGGGTYADDNVGGISTTDEVSKYSKRCENQDIVSDKKLTKEKMIQDMKNNICNVIYKWQQLQLSKLSTSGDSSLDTWVFPLIQMGEFNITQDEYVTRKLMVSAPKGSHLQLATGYFNLTEQYTRTLLDQCKANVSLLMAHPNANGFLGAAGPAGGIPFAYSLIAKQFWQRVVDSNQASRIRMLEYERPGWTFHAKGLWYYPPGSDVPWATVIGSANLGERSVKRDLEAQAAIFTVSPELQARLQQETKRLHSYSKECGEELLSRETPKWVRATVKLFRTYF